MQMLHSLAKVCLHRYATVFLLAMVLSVFGYYGQSSVSAANTTLPGTLPPGTIPPGTVPPPNQAKVTIIHAAPFAPILADTAVDVCTQSGVVILGLDDIEYLENVVAILPPGEYDVKVAKSGTNCTDVVLDIAPITLLAGQEVILILTGDGTNQPLGSLLVITTRGQMKLYLPIIAKS